MVTEGINILIISTFTRVPREFSSAARTTASSVIVRAKRYALTHLATPKQRTVLFGEVCCSTSLTAYAVKEDTKDEGTVVLSFIKKLINNIVYNGAVFNVGGSRGKAKGRVNYAPPIVALARP